MFKVLCLAKTYIAQIVWLPYSSMFLKRCGWLIELCTLYLKKHDVKAS